MRINRIQNRTKVSREQITHEQMRDECSHWIGEMFNPIQPHSRSCKAMFNKVSGLTGIGTRRIEKLWRKYVVKPHAQEHEAIGAAYQRWLEAHDRNEGEHADHRQALLDYGAARWRDVSKLGKRDIPGR